MNKKLNRYYIGSMVTFFAMFSSMFSFVSTFLLHKGFDNTSIGTILSLTGVLSILLQMSLANFLDKKPDVRIQNVVTIHGILIILLAFTLLFTPANNWMLLLILVIFAVTQASETLLNALAFVFEKFGLSINYGVARGMGSLSFAVATLLIGFVTEAISPDIIPLFYVIFSMGLILSVRAFRHPQENAIGASELKRPSITNQEAADDSLLAFLSRYKRLVFLMVGVVFLLFTHILINNFFIQIILPIGGNYATMGTALFIGAVLELPTMFVYDKIEQRISTQNLLKIAGLFLLAKHALTYFAPSMGVIYFAQFIQIGGFALIYPASVSYIRQVVSKEDMVKGQSLFTIAMALSSVSGGFIGGYLLDQAGVANTLLVGVLATIIGVVIVFLGTDNNIRITKQ